MSRQHRTVSTEYLLRKERQYVVDVHHARGMSMAWAWHCGPKKKTPVSIRTALHPLQLPEEGHACGRGQRAYAPSRVIRTFARWVSGDPKHGSNRAN